MVHLMKELQPTDHFEIKLPHALSTNERQLVTLFYQPLTGAEPISLYLTLWAEAESYAPQEMNHYYLMNVLSMPLPKVFEARIALEAIGLLRTWKKDLGTSRHFIYELVRPLDAQSFFKDPLLSMFLFSKIGEGPYRKLRQRFIAQPNNEAFEEVTRTFIDVYKPVHTNVPTDFNEEEAPKQQDYPFYYEQFDFQLLQSGLSEQLVPSSALTVEAREMIAKLSFLYKLSPIDMQKVVILALDEQMKLPTEKLKKAAADYYKLAVSKDAPTFTKTFQSKQVEETSPQNLSKEQELLQYLETTPPVQVLRDINKGKEPLPSSIQLAEDLVVTYSMPVGVVNVLLEYVMLSTDMKLPRSYVEKIADHWSRKHLKTAKEAMDLARQERDKYAQWKTESATPKPSTNPSKPYQKPPASRKNTRNEQVPDWFYKRDEQPKQEDTSAVDFEKERLKILQKLDQQQK
ncbi:MAG: DnaD domain protein [Solibacillus sp.]